MRRTWPQPLHERLQSLLQDSWRAGVFTQGSLARAIGKDQTNVGQYLRGGKAGPLNLDEADAALRHIGSSLEDFLAGIPPRPLTPTDQVLRGLAHRPVLIQLVRDMLDVPLPQLAAVIAWARTAVELAIGPPAGRTGAPRAGTTRGRRTRAVREKRR